MTADIEFGKLADELAKMRRRKIELGQAALTIIRGNDAELADRLQDAFGADDEKAATWLTQSAIVLDLTPIELLADGRRDVIKRLLASIVHGMGV
jgi:hypothetical protein